MSKVATDTLKDRIWIVPWGNNTVKRANKGCGLCFKLYYLIFEKS
jgi:hypothetical protein